MTQKARNKKCAMRSSEDVLGSYTGVCADNALEQPVQDADDL